ncbi:MAG: ATP-binding protein, partial [Ginsengibacter sp.]
KLLPAEVTMHNGLNPTFHFYEIFYTDNGIGFDQQFSEDIFLIFHRLNNDQQYSGTGIGLALCKRIVDNHHGKIYAEGKENEGASFTIILPAKQSYFL